MRVDVNSQYSPEKQAEPIGCVCVFVCMHVHVYTDMHMQTHI